MSLNPTIFGLIGLALTSGINLYATVAILGLAVQFHWLGVPQMYHDISVFGHPAVWITALVLYVIEFFMDKIPLIDSLWDVIHTVIRPAASAIIGYTSLRSMPEMAAIMGLLNGSISLSSHAAKAGFRALVNTSPEPFSNIIVSLSEDGFVVFFVLLALSHPYAALAVVVAFLILFAVFGPMFFRLIIINFFGLYKWLMYAFNSGNPGYPSRAIALPLNPRFENALEKKLGRREAQLIHMPFYTYRSPGMSLFSRGSLVATDAGLHLITRRRFKTIVRTLSGMKFKRARWEITTFKQYVLLEPEKGKNIIIRFYKEPRAYFMQCAAMLAGMMRIETLWRGTDAPQGLIPTNIIPTQAYSKSAYQQSPPQPGAD